MEDHESSDTKEFTIFISRKNWVKQIIRPLMELSATSDPLTIHYCRRFLFLILRDINEVGRKSLHFDPLRLTTKPTKEMLEPYDVKNPTEEMVERRRYWERRKENAREQLSALVSFKDALCTETCILGLSNYFNRNWQRELEMKVVERLQEQNPRDSWKNVGAALNCIRRLLEIDTHPIESTADEILKCSKAHLQLIVYFRSIFMAISGMFAQLYEDIEGTPPERYYDNWLRYMYSILRNCLCNFSATDLFLIWKEKGILATFQNVEDKDGRFTEKVVYDESMFTVGSDVPVPQAIERLHSLACKGEIQNQLLKEKYAKLSANSFKTRVEGRHNRFGGTYIRNNANRERSAVIVTPEARSASESIAAIKNETSKDAKENKDKENKEEGAANADSSKSEPQSNVNMARAPGEPEKFVQRGINFLLEDNVPQAKGKNVKRNLTFAANKNNSSDSQERKKLDRTGQEACVVVATFLDLICSSKGLNSLAYRVSKDRKRDDGIFAGDMELIYYEVVSKSLHFNRLKLMEQKKNFDVQQKAQAKAGAAKSEMKGWEPDLSNMFYAIDMLSITNVLYSMEYLHKRNKYMDIVKPMEVYKEMVCYMRVQLESANPAQRDFAVAALHKVFYTTTEKKDPLPRLLSEWKTGTYSKRHLNCLVELLHETMKTLDYARSIFSDEEEIAKARKRKSKSDSSSLEQFIAAAYRFNVEEYFKRLVNNSTVRIYTKLLEKYAENEAHVNHYGYIFLRRVCGFKLEQNYPSPSEEEIAAFKKKQSSLEAFHYTNVTPAPFGLLFMFFNLNTMMVFNTMLNDRHLITQRAMGPLLCLIKSIVKRFFQAARKNRNLYTEILFQHPHTHSFLEKVDNVYDATTYRMGAMMGSSGRNSRERGSRSVWSDDEEDVTAEEVADNAARDSVRNFIIEDSDDEFDEGAITTLPKDYEQKMKAEQKRKKAIENRARRGLLSKKKGTGSDDDDLAEDHLALSALPDDDDDEENIFASRATKGRSKRPKRSAAKSKKKGDDWTEAEDQVLREMYAKFVGDESVFIRIATSEELEMATSSGSRSSKDVEKRVQTLGLHMQLQSESEDEEMEALKITRTSPVKELSQADREDLFGSDEDGEVATQEQKRVIDDDDYASASHANAMDEEETVAASTSASKKRPSPSSSQKRYKETTDNMPVEPAPWDSTEVTDSRRFEGVEHFGESRKKLRKTQAKKSSQDSDDDDFDFGADE